MKGENEDEQTGIEIVRRAIEEPLRQIVHNAGKEGAVVVDKVRNGKGDFGYNARKDEYENLLSFGWGHYVTDGDDTRYHFDLYTLYPYPYR